MSWTSVSIPKADAPSRRPRRWSGVAVAFCQVVLLAVLGSVVSWSSGEGTGLAGLPSEDKPTFARHQAGSAPGGGAGTPAGSQSAAASSKVDVFIGFWDRPGQDEETFVRGHGGRVKYTYSIVRAIAASVPEDAIDRMRSDRRVSYVEPDLDVFAVDHESPELANTWGVDRIGSGGVHHLPNAGTGVKVAVLDSGIVGHLDLPAYEPTCSYNFVTGTLVPTDGHGHGTHVAGTVAALMNGFGVVGAAPAATLCVYKVLSDSGSGSWSNIVAALERAVKDKVPVANHSYGSSTDPGTTVKLAYDNSYMKGLLHAGAAGNNGTVSGRGNNCIYPARYASVIATAATRTDDTRASFSSTCSENELAAPGAQVNSTTKEGAYAAWNGTSMASPHVAGAAALVLAANPSMSNVQIRQRLQETAQDLGAAGRDTHYGYGLVRADLAAGSVLPPSSPTGSVSGTVTDGSNPISAATVSISDQSTTTSDSGWYTIVGVPVGDQPVTVSKSGYQSQTTTATVFENQTTSVDFVLAVSTGSVSGVVTDGSTGIAGATVAVDTGQWTTATGDGSYTIAGVPVGSRSVTASTGDQSQTKTASVFENQTTNVNFALVPETSPSTVRIQSIDYWTDGGRAADKHLNVVIALVDDLENPVSGASVSIEVYRDGNIVSSGSGTTRSDGKVAFSLKNAPPGCYETVVTSVEASGLNWVDGTPSNERCK